VARYAARPERRAPAVGIELNLWIRKLVEDVAATVDEAGIQFVRLILSGAFDKYPKLQIILGHWGEVILFYTERLAAMNRFAGLKRPINDYLRENLYVTASGMYSNAYLERTVELIGTDRILFSADYPYQYRPGRDARNFLENTPLSDTDRERFAFKNWETLTGE